MAGYQWLTFLTARQQLAARLADSGNVFWTDTECGLYIVNALRMFNTLTFTWKQDFVFNSSSLWNSLGTLINSPRLRTLTDTNCYTLMEYMLLEPPTGGTWTGTSQFTINDFSTALQHRRDETLQISNCNQLLLPNIALTPNTRRTYVPDTVIDVERVRYLPLQATTTGTAASAATSVTLASITGIATGQLVTGTNIVYPTIVTEVGSTSITIYPATTGVVSGTLKFYTASTLYRDDTIAQEFYEAPLYQQASGTPQTFMLTSEPPLSWDVDVPPNQPGAYEAVVLESGAAFSPPAATLLNVPNDFAWALIWGAIADLLGRESEATDRARATYCLRRYQDGLNLLLKTPWIMLAKVNGAAVDVPSIAAMDRYAPEWDSTPATFGPCVVAGGIDCIAAPQGSGIGVTVLANAPVPSFDADYVQVSRSNWDIVLDLAQVFATFKQGGTEFQSALELESRAIQACAAENNRLKSMGSFSDILVQRGQAQDRNQERYNNANQAVSNTK
jgi:hypothetical protein